MSNGNWITHKGARRHYGRGDKDTITLDYLALLDIILPETAGKGKKEHLCDQMGVEPREYVVFCPTYKGRYVSLVTVVKDAEGKLKRGVVAINLNGKTSGMIVEVTKLSDVPFLVVDAVADLLTLPLKRCVEDE